MLDSTPLPSERLRLPATRVERVLLKSDFARYGLKAGDVVDAEVTRSPLIPAFRGCSEAVWTAPSGIRVSLGTIGFDWIVEA